jgi:Transglycosylase-like domain
MRFLPLALIAVLALALPTTASARDPFPKSAGTKCKSAVIKAHYSARYYRVKARHGTRTPGRNIRRYGLNNHRKSKCKHLRRSSRTFKRWLAPPPAPVYAGDTSSANHEPAYAGGAYSIPTDIVMCESGGDYGAVNPSSGAFGAYQVLPSTWSALCSDLARDPAGQDACAARIMATQGRGAWVC